MTLYTLILENVSRDEDVKITPVSHLLLEEQISNVNEGSYDRGRKQKMDLYQKIRISELKFRVTRQEGVRH